MLALQPPDAVLGNVSDNRSASPTENGYSHASKRFVM